MSVETSPVHTHTCCLCYIPTGLSTKPLELRGDTHDMHKPIKTESCPELHHDALSSHEMKSSVIRIPHEYE